jgi:TRAP-type mannitol/chloroaromatic compound transport system permease small subunit
MTYMLYGTFFMLGAAYTLRRGGHIRTDSFYGEWSPRRQGLVDAIGYLVFFFPPLLVLLWLGLDFFGVSFGRGERVVSSPWMPVVYPLKGMIPLAARCSCSRRLRVRPQSPRRPHGRVAGALSGVACIVTLQH